MKIILCRHGESSNNVKKDLARANDNSRLTFKGEKQSKKLGAVLKKYKVKKIYFSPKYRCADTAKIICKNLRLPGQPMAEFKERGWGNWGFKTWREVSSQLDIFSLAKRYKFIPPGGESWQAMEKRLVKGLNKIIEQQPGSIAIITHRGCLRALLPVLKKVSRSRHYQYDVGLGSVVAIRLNGKIKI